jgi:glycosyltransferase involved in cell wall biosynthesis
MPTVSVTIPSYNHGKYIKECIQSVLDQSFQDFEIIITDDCSSDNSVEIIESIDDPRIKLFKHTRNFGACIAANNSILHSHGKYIAMLSSDDAWYPEKLAVQVEYLENHHDRAAVFGKVDWIDESGKKITNLDFPSATLFEVENRTRFQWLRYFFLSGNCLCHPCSLVRRECYSIVGMLNPAFASLPDLDLWIRLCLNYDIWISDQRLIKFRRFRDESNASGNNDKTFLRNQFEHRHALDNYLNISDSEEFLLIFPEAIKYGEVTSETIPYLLGRMAMDSGIDYKVLWGMDTIYSQLLDEKKSKLLEDKCEFTYRDFLELTARQDPFGVFQNSQIALTKKGFIPKIRSLVMMFFLIIVIEMKRKCPAWLKLQLKKGIFKIHSNPRLNKIVQRFTPGFVSRMYYRVKAL